MLGNDANLIISDLIIKIWAIGSDAKLIRENWNLLVFRAKLGNDDNLIINNSTTKI